MSGRFSADKHLTVRRRLLRNYYERCIPEEVKNYAESAAYRAAEPATLAKLSGYADFIKA